LSFTIEKSTIRDLVVIRHNAFQDDRGFFFEVFNKNSFEKAGLPTEFVQSNHSGSVAGVIRGLHFQWNPQMGKLMRVSRGAAFLVAVDIRIGSPTLGKWFGIEASESNRLQVFAPAGFARGFCVTSEKAEVQYLCTGTYSNTGESGILWNDPEIGIDWPATEKPILSGKDETAQTLREWLTRPEAQYFQY
jgi:dTDP-4-dehydrorhamnose 3,5-epimerase